MRKFLKLSVVILIVLLCAVKASAQDPRIAKFDSLIRLAETDTGRINLILKKLVVLSTTNLDSAIELATTTLE
jgi:hypothetical protein